MDDLKNLSSKKEQYLTVLAIEVVIIAVASLIAWGSWSILCDDAGWRSCLSDGAMMPLSFLLLCLFRPFLFTPTFIMAIVGGQSFGYVGGVLFSALGATLSTFLIYLPAKVLGKRFVKPWLSSNLPAMLQLIRTQDYKVVFATRLIPFFPFDFMSIVFGVTDFRTKSVLIATFFGVLPESLLFARIVGTEDSEIVSLTIGNLATLSIGIIVSLLIYEMFFRRDGSNILVRSRRVYQELVEELRANNSIIKHQEYTPDRTPVIMLYGFFSSRRTLTILEKLFTNKGHQVMCFNLGGLFGVFNTRSITETAKFIDTKIKRQIERHGFKKVVLVCHSKGGLIALWWALRLGGSKYCDTIITMGSPFKGSRLTYLALITPLGFIWRDVWQMRPGSKFLKLLHAAEMPDNMRIFCLHSVKDKVARGKNGLFEPQRDSNFVESVPMNHVAHFEFLFRRDVADVLENILQKESDRVDHLEDTDDGHSPPLRSEG